MARELVMYTRRRGCPYVTIARGVLTRNQISCREVNIDDDNAARQRLLDWVGFLSVPTFVVAAPGEVVPAEPPAPLAKGASPRDIDRGSMLTEPSADGLTAWLRKHGFLAG